MTSRPGANLVRAVIALAVLSLLMFLSWLVMLPLLVALAVLAAAAFRERQLLRAAFANISVDRALPANRQARLLRRQRERVAHPAHQQSGRRYPQHYRGDSAAFRVLDQGKSGPIHVVEPALVLSAA